MALAVEMPQLGFDIRKSRLLRWVKREGDAVRKGEPLAEVETEKVTLEVEAPADGVLLRTLVTEGAEAEVGTVIAYLGEPGEEVSETPVRARGGEAGAVTRELSPMRQAIARLVSASKQQIPHFYVTAAIEMDAAVELRRQVNQEPGKGAKVSLNDLVTKGVALALVRVPQLNATWQGERLLVHEQVNIGVAVSTEEGIVIPVVGDCERKSLAEIARETAAVVERARSGRLSAREYVGGTFTISNMGMYQVESFAAIIYPPQVAILAVGRTWEEAVVRGGELQVARVMRVTVSCDHRAMDGADAARFVGELKQVMEAPAALLG